jgi:demethylmenaquinone methyltransferase/2-methoxy-6-polyprenyl-1,4-benzoquinol methylase
MKEPSRSDVWKMFDQISSTYDKLNRILSLGMDLRWRKKVTSHLPTRKNLQVLDLATGTADQLIALFEHSQQIEKAIGIDLAEEMLAMAKKKINQKLYKDKIQLIKGDAEHLSFESNLFDVATFSFGIRNVASPLISLKEIYRVLHPNGKALILEFALPPFPFKPIYLFYLRHILPKIGAFFSKNPTAYRYLNETIETFPQGKAFCKLMQEAGFKSVSFHKMGFGAVALYEGTKSPTI